MLSTLFLGLSMTGAEWVLYLLVLMSILSVGLMFERWKYYRTATNGIDAFREKLRAAIAQGKWDEAATIAKAKMQASREAPDFESGMAFAVLSSRSKEVEVLNQIAQDEVLRARVQWERFLSTFATISSNAPFIGLFGTVLGIIKAFHDLSSQAVGGAGAQAVSAGLSEALVATAVGLLVAIPASVAYNHFRQRVKKALQTADALKSYLVGQASGR